MKGLAEWLGKHVTQEKTVEARRWRVAFHLVSVLKSHQYKFCMRGIIREIKGD